MNIILFLLILFSYNVQAYDYKILRVTDGDTIVIEAPYLPKPLKPEIPLRINGLDTPEKNFLAHCELEKKKGELATNFTKNLIDSANAKNIIIEDKDKYFRLLGDVILDGKSLREQLLFSGYARPYKGDKKSNWCN